MNGPNIDTPASTMNVDITMNTTEKKASLLGTPNIRIAATAHPRHGIPMINASVLGKGAVNSRDSHIMIAESKPIAHKRWRKDTIIPVTTKTRLTNG